MPLVLDDVLVNFDVDRSKAAAATLRDFAAAGHQLLVFTCHEHLAAMFKSLGVRVRRLPSNTDLAELPELESAPEPEPETPRRRRSRSAKSEAEAKPPEPTAEPVRADFPAPQEPLVAVTFAVEPAFAQPLITASAIAEPIAAPPAYQTPIEPVWAELIPPQPVELPVRPVRAARQHRADPPHRRLALSRVADGWWSEEFAGELDDRIAHVAPGDESADE